MQDRWDALRHAKAALAARDYAPAMKTGVFGCRLKWIGVKDGYEVEEYEINTAIIESLNSMERRGANETGQEVDRQDNQLGAKSNQRRERWRSLTIDLPNADREPEKADVLKSPVAVVK